MLSTEYIVVTYVAPSDLVVGKKRRDPAPRIVVVAISDRIRQETAAYSIEVA